MNTIRGIAHGELAGEADKAGFMEIIPATGWDTKVTLIHWNSADTDMELIFHTATQTGSGAAETVVNKIAGGPAPGTTAKTEALPEESIAGTVALTRKHSANVEVELDFTDAPLIIQPGNYLVLACVAENKTINYCTVHFHEIER